MNIREAAAVLGGEAVNAKSLLAPGPGHSPRDRSLSVTFDPNAPDGFLCNSFSGDDWKICRDFIKDALNISSSLRWPNTPRRPKAKLAADDDQESKIKEALRIWSEALDPRGSVVERYLTGRGLNLEGGIPGDVLRFHRALPFYRDRALVGIFPTMVALMRDLRTDQPRAIHRTFLHPDGSPILVDGKKAKKMYGPAKGTAIKLDADDDVELGLVVCEGIETGLAGRQLGYKPVWALGSAGSIGSLPVLGGVEALTISGETGDDGKNLSASLACARRWLAAGAEVSLLEPFGGHDANDVLQARAAR